MDTKQPDSPPDFALGLALAVVGSSVTPLVLLDGELKVVAVSASFCEAFDTPSRGAIGRCFVELGDGAWNTPELRALLAESALGGPRIKAHEMELLFAGKQHHLILNAHKLDYGSGSPTRVIVSVTDVSDVRANEKSQADVLAEAAALIQDIRHRAANSLQVIASLLMRAARNAHSEETRGHLHSAHHRIMSVSELERQLALSHGGEIALRPYITKLCDSISASMMQDSGKISLEVLVDNSTLDADTSVGLGLIVTELVINALKHAFPEGREGKVTVEFECNHGAWTLTVRDNGVGRIEVRSKSSSGLGTQIVEGLARQRDAKVTVRDAKPGTLVSVVHVAAGTKGSEPPSPL